MAVEFRGVYGAIDQIQLERVTEKWLVKSVEFPIGES